MLIGMGLAVSSLPLLGVYPAQANLGEVVQKDRRPVLSMPHSAPTGLESFLNVKYEKVESGPTIIKETIKPQYEIHRYESRKEGNDKWHTNLVATLRYITAQTTTGEKIHIIWEYKDNFSNLLYTVTLGEGKNTASVIDLKTDPQERFDEVRFKRIIKDYLITNGRLGKLSGRQN